MKKNFLANLILSILLLALVLPGSAPASTTSSYQTSLSTDNGASWDFNYTGKTYVMWQAPQILFKLKGLNTYDTWLEASLYPYNVVLDVDGVRVYNAGGTTYSPVTEGQWIMNTAQFAEGTHNLKTTYYHKFYYGWRESYDYSTITLTGPATKPKTATSLTLSVKPKKAQPGKKVLVKGRLTDAGGNGLAGKAIKVKVREKTVKTLVTDAAGFFKFKTRAKKTKIFQAVFDGDTDYLASSSSLVKSVVKR